MGGSILYSEFDEQIAKYPDYKSIDTFIETGTYKGDTIHEMSKHFKTCFTFELHPTLYNEAMTIGKSLGINNVNYINGDSVVELPKTIDTCNLNKPCIFFLDSHVSGRDSTYIYAYPVPLLNELEIIANKCKEVMIICIDDVRFFTKADQIQPFPYDWAHITIDKINDLFKGRIRESFIQNDRYWLLLDKI